MHIGAAPAAVQAPLILILSEQHREEAAVCVPPAEIPGGSAPVWGKWLLPELGAAEFSPPLQHPQGWAGRLPPALFILCTHIVSTW